MKNNTEGAWIIHHTQKLQQVTGGGNFDEIDASGKCGMLLSALSESDNNATLNADKVKVLAKSAGIKILELPSILKRLETENLVDVSKTGDVAVLGLTTPMLLTHTSDLFRKNNPSQYEKAALELSEKISLSPIQEKFAKEFIGDTYKLSSGEALDLIQQSEEVGFIDSESVGKDDKLLFNGNLFKRDNLKKTSSVLDSLTPQDVRKVQDIDAVLTKDGCVPLEMALTITGQPLLEKLQSIGMYDFNEVINDEESRIFITKPSAFNKFGNPLEDDAFDLAKAFVASLSYGMIYSSQGRGKINLLKVLLKRLIQGHEVGSATAIGQDYKVLELKGVVQLRHDRGTRFSMKLLKKDIGILALHVLESGDASEQSALTLNGSSITGYNGPESKRVQTRKKKQTKESKIQIIEALRTIRQ